MQRSEQHGGKVYFLAAGPFLKVGYTEKPAHCRQRQLANNSPFEAKLAAVLSNAARFDEAKVHEEIRHAQIRGEWFELHDPRVTELVRVASECSTVRQFAKAYRKVDAGSIVNLVPTREMFDALRVTMRRLRQEHGITYHRMAKEIGVDPSVLCCVEHTLFSVNPSVIRKLSDWCGVAPTKLITGEPQSKAVAS